MSILSNLGQGFKEIGLSFVKDASIWWLITPVIIFWTIIEIYLDKYKKEELGWNTALGNGLSVLWVALICLKFLFENRMQNFDWTKLMGIILILLYGALVVFNSYYHKLKKQISYILAAPTSIYFLSLVAILWTYGFLPINIWTIIDLIIILIIVGLIEILLKKIIKPKDSEESFS